MVIRRIRASLIRLRRSFGGGAPEQDLGVGPTDPVAFLAVPLVLGATAYAACRIPASAVVRVDPLTTLRDE